MDSHKLYMVEKRKFAALKWYLVCENRLRIEVFIIIIIRATPYLGQRLQQQKSGLILLKRYLNFPQ